MRELKELRPHPSRPVGTPSPGEAGEGKDRFLSFLAFSTIPQEGNKMDSFINNMDTHAFRIGRSKTLFCHQAE